MTRQMKKAVYEVPITECFQVELEGVFCASMVNDTQKGSVDIEGHEVIVTDGSIWNNQGNGNDNMFGWE